MILKLSFFLTVCFSSSLLLSSVTLSLSLLSSLKCAKMHKRPHTYERCFKSYASYLFPSKIQQLQEQIVTAILTDYHTTAIKTKKFRDDYQEVQPLLTCHKHPPLMSWVNIKGVITLGVTLVQRCRFNDKIYLLELQNFNLILVFLLVI